LVGKITIKQRFSVFIFFASWLFLASGPNFDRDSPA
jgi:hypothetical protein